MKVEMLTHLMGSDFDNWGHNGYISQQVFSEKAISENNSFCFKFILKQLDKAYIKTWETTSANIDHFNEIILAGHSFGAYEKDKLIGMVICGERNWNNTLYIENILVAEEHRGKGIGKLLIEKTIRHSQGKNFRLIELETQNTNIAAILFYQKQGFEITGLNLKLYNDKNNEIAIYMSRSNL
jgi:ribosomal protein S18 acetylase RimI-like enzyme